MSKRFLLLFFVVVVSLQWTITEQACRCLSNNSTCWPNATVWRTFNVSVDGRLISVRPSAAVCHSNPVNVNACGIAINQWNNASWRGDQVGGMQNHNWENSSCSVFLPNIPCQQGSVPQLAVNAIRVEHVQTTVRLASAYNLRLVMKTTGHDYMGRSTAAGSLLLWLHHMKNMTLIEQFSLCSGERISKAIRLGAGVQWGEVYAWLSQYNLTAIGGASATVGATGGFLQGGGHGPLTRWKGLAADQILEFDVVTADGRRQTANGCQNSDLFWALRGGGGGTFAIVISVVLRTFPSPSVVGAIYAIYAPNETRYTNFIRDFVRFLPILADAGWSGYFYMTDRNINIALLLPNGNLSIANATLNQLIINNKDVLTQNFLFPIESFYDYFAAIMAPTNPTGSNVLLGSRLIPETIVRKQSDQLADVFLRIRGQQANQSTLIGHLVAGGQVSNISVDNSVSPVWRTALLHMIYAQTWPDGTSTVNQNVLVKRVRNQVEILQTMSGDSQSSGCYMNEADPNEPNWQQKYFGTQTIYNQLKAIKKAYDPRGLFVCKNCVGSDDWSSDLNCPKVSSTGQSHRINIFVLSFFLVIYI